MQKLLTAEDAELTESQRLKLPNYQISQLRNRRSSRYRRHNRNIVPIGNGGCFLLKISHIFIVQIDIHEGAQLALVGIKMPAQIWMRGDEARQGFPDG